MKEGRKGGALAKLAGMWCGSPDFWVFLASRFDKQCGDAQAAAEIVRMACGVTSRAELDSVPAAEARFHASIRLPYMRWQQGVCRQV